MEGWRDLAVFAHAAAGLIDHEDLMILFPLVPLMLVTIILVATTLGQRGLLGPRERTVTTSGALAAVAATLSLGAAAIHFAVIAEHLAIDVAFGLFFLGLAWFQAIWSQLHLVRRSSLLAGVAVLVNVFVIVTWFVSRTTGLPFGPTPWQVQSIGTLDIFATTFEIALVAVLIPSALPRRWPELSAQRMPFERALVLTTFVLLTVTLLAGLALVTAPVAASAIP